MTPNPRSCTRSTVGRETGGSSAKVFTVPEWICAEPPRRVSLLAAAERRRLDVLSAKMSPNARKAGRPITTDEMDEWQRLFALSGGYRSNRNWATAKYRAMARARDRLDPEWKTATRYRGAKDDVMEETGISGSRRGVAMRWIRDSWLYVNGRRPTVEQFYEEVERRIAPEEVAVVRGLAPRFVKENPALFL